MYVFLSLYIYCIHVCYYPLQFVLFGCTNVNVFRERLKKNPTKNSLFPHLDLMLCWCYVDVSDAMSMLIGVYFRLLVQYVIWFDWYWLTVSRRCLEHKIEIIASDGKTYLHTCMSHGRSRGINNKYIDISGQYFIKL